MQILITHGYLLTGTGSNLYVSNLVRELCKLGHDIFLVCQDYDPEDLDFISEIYEFESQNKNLQLVKSIKTPFSGSCRFFRPDLEEFLPVYVFDHYNNFEVKEFPNCTTEEIQNYLNLNQNALNTILDNFKIDLIQTNHTIPFPYIISKILEEKAIPHFVTVHGSALNFSVRKDNRLLPFTIKGFESSSEIFVDSQYAFDELVEFLEQNQMSSQIKKVKIIPAGVDIDKFNILKTSRLESINNFLNGISSLVDNKKGRTKNITEKILTVDLKNNQEVEQLVEETQTDYDYRFIDQDLYAKIKQIDWENDQIVIFIGKYLWTKGIYLILLAIPFILKKYPNTKFVFVGFGPFREIAEIMLNLLSKKQLDLLRSLIDENSLFSNSNNEPLPLLVESVKNHQKQIEEALEETSHKLIDSVIFTGIVDHSNLQHLLPGADVLIAPSVFPEAFGMVAIEALSAGVFPIVTYQSAFKEIADQISKELMSDFTTQPVLLNDEAFLKIAENVIAVFSHLDRLEEKNQLDDFKKSLREIVVENFSWTRVAQRYINFYQDHLNSI